MADETEPTTTTSADDATDVAAAVITDGAYALVVADFSDIDAAWEAYDELDGLVDAASLKIEGVLVLKKDAGGTVEVQKLTDHSARRGLTWGVVGGVVLGVIFPPSIIGSAAVLGAAGAGIGGLQKRHHRKELAEELTDAIDPGHSGLVLLVSDPAAVELQHALAKADHIVNKAVDKAAAEDIKAEAKAAQATEDGSATS
jgi:uncharacterized membrane protein